MYSNWDTNDQDIKRMDANVQYENACDWNTVGQAAMALSINHTYMAHPAKCSSLDAKSSWMLLRFSVLPGVD